MATAFPTHLLARPPALANEAADAARRRLEAASRVRQVMQRAAPLPTTPVVSIGGVADQFVRCGETWLGDTALIWFARSPVPRRD
jgi:hypothetical protein